MHKKRLLIVDDEHLVLKSLEVNLKREGFDVYTATGFDDAMALIGQHHFDVILSDFHLGNLSGRDLMLQVKKIAPAARFIIFSGYEDEALFDNILSEGADIFLPKPFKLSDILAAINRL
jgi:DNA-binding NtrC family response regulator